MGKQSNSGTFTGFGKTSFMATAKAGRTYGESSKGPKGGTAPKGKK